MKFKAYKWYARADGEHTKKFMIISDIHNNDGKYEIIGYSKELPMSHGYRYSYPIGTEINFSKITMETSIKNFTPIELDWFEVFK